MLDTNTFSKPEKSGLLMTTSQECIGQVDKPLRIKRRGRYRTITRSQLQTLTTTTLRRIPRIHSIPDSLTTQPQNNLNTKTPTQHNTTNYSFLSNHPKTSNLLKPRRGHTTFCLWKGHYGVVLSMTSTNSCVGNYLTTNQSWLPRMRGTLSAAHLQHTVTTPDSLRYSSGTVQRVLCRLLRHTILYSLRYVSDVLLSYDSNRVTAASTDPPTSHPNSTQQKRRGRSPWVFCWVGFGGGCFWGFILGMV